MAIITISMPDEVLVALDKLVTELGYPSRSEFIRDALMEKLEDQTKQYKYRIIIAVSNHKKYPRVDEKIMASSYRIAQSLRALYHQDLGDGRCLTIIVVDEGTSASLLSSKIRAIKGIEQVKTYRI